MLQEPSIGFVQSFLQADPCPPAEMCQTRHLEQLSRGPVGLAGIKDQKPPETDYPFNGFSDIADSAVKAGSHIAVRHHGFGMRLPDIRIKVHHLDPATCRVGDANRRE